MDYLVRAGGAVILGAAIAQVFIILQKGLLRGLQAIIKRSGRSGNLNLAELLGLLARIALAVLFLIFGVLLPRLLIRPAYYLKYYISALTAIFLLQQPWSLRWRTTTPSRQRQKSLSLGAILNAQKRPRIAAAMGICLVLTGILAIASMAARHRYSGTTLLFTGLGYLVLLMAMLIAAVAVAKVRQPKCIEIPLGLLALAFLAIEVRALVASWPLPTGIAYASVGLALILTLVTVIGIAVLRRISRHTEE